MKRRTVLAPIAAATAMVLTGVVFGGTAGATLTGTTFEGNDGNVIVDTAGNSDWVNAPNRSIQTDQTTGQCDNSYTQGSKEDDTNVVIGLGSIPNSKADLGKFAVASETRPNGDVFMYLAWTRNNLSGTTNFDFEINQQAQPDMTIGCPGADRAIVLKRTGDATASNTPGGPLPDDLLISYDIQGGSQTPTLSFRRWTGTAWSNPVTLTSTNSEGRINSAPVTFDGVTYPAAAFGEASINMTGAGIIPNQNQPNASCVAFGSAYVKSRASSSFTAQMKDYIAPASIGLDNCGSIKVLKDTLPAGDPTSFHFTTSANLDANGFDLTDATVPSAGNGLYTGLNPGTYTVTETVPSHWTNTGLSCTSSGGANTTPNVISGAQVQIKVDPNEDVVCTYTNTKLGSITIAKVTQPSPDPTDTSFQFTSSTLGTVGPLKNGQSDVHSDLAPGTYDAAETVPTGWTLSDASCSDGSPVSAIALSAGENVTCTFTNTGFGHIIVHKQTDPAGSPAVFDFAASYNAAGFSLSDGQSNDSGAIAPGTYSVSETVPTGWAQSGATCSDGSDPSSIGLSPGETVDCYFSNRQDAHIIVVKHVTGPNPDNQSFPFTASYNASGFSLVDGGQNDSGALVPGTYSVSEGSVPNWALIGSSCNDGSDPSSISLSAGETVICTFDNQHQVGSITLTKVSVKTGGDGQPIPLGNVSFQITGSGGYSNTVTTNASGVVCTDFLPFGEYNVHELTPTGFQGADDVQVTVDNVAYCGDGLGEAQTIQNTPLTNISVSVHSQVPTAAGGSASVIDCGPLGQVATDPNGDATLPVNDLLPQTVTCTITIDP